MFLKIREMQTPSNSLFPSLWVSWRCSSYMHTSPKRMNRDFVCEMKTVVLYYVHSAANESRCSLSARCNEKSLLHVT